MRILFGGDTHGNTPAIEKLARQARQDNCDCVFILGDFGYWEHTSEGRAWLYKVNRVMNRELGMPLYWIDGNHENHTLLREKHVKGRDEMIEIYPKVIYVPRGHSWEWDEVKFTALGGAYSVDVGSRIEGRDWWPEEMITYSEAKRAVDKGKTDVLLTHDCPLEVPLGSVIPGFYKVDMNTASNRGLISSVVDEVQPKVILHGHYHSSYVGTYDFKHGRVVVHGLDASWPSQSWNGSYRVFDTEDWK